MSHLHMPMVMLQVQTVMPFIIIQQVHMPPASSGAYATVAALPP